MLFRETASHQARPAAAAGRFYPGDAAELRATITHLLSEATVEPIMPKALIAPHAGYPYSGPIAASAFSTLKSIAGSIERVVLIGPSHFERFEGVALSSAESFETPLGHVAVDLEAVRKLKTLRQVVVNDAAHAKEHSLEVELPFLQLTIPGFKVVPIATGLVSSGEVSEVLETLWGGPETLIVVSSDLSHYYDSAIARKLDQGTADAICRLDEAGIPEDNACGRPGICGLLLSARKHRLCAKTLDLRNSGDTAGPRNQVVGYGAFGFSA